MRKILEEKQEAGTAVIVYDQQGLARLYQEVFRDGGADAYLVKPFDLYELVRTASRQVEDIHG